MILNYYYNKDDYFAFKTKHKIDKLLSKYDLDITSSSLIVISSLMNKTLFLKNINTIEFTPYQSVYAVFLEMGSLAISPGFDSSANLNCIQCFYQRLIAHFARQSLNENLSKINQFQQEQVVFKSFLETHSNLAAKILSQKILHREHSNKTTQLINLFSLNYTSLNFNPLHKCQCRNSSDGVYQDFSSILT
ncbi:hypothetical protein [Entomobacter blattae]|uniref:Uncharacterized protein n=1 Tax=Entomobacter blattae TaxID=2762277 RepID=A0A7H1NSP8_9PROT|nr:hypothetical protein [Entomobacter blattae]QNT78808.1 hypothetical protein JGUZn3_15850 [Entomobacter blattae]